MKILSGRAGVFIGVLCVSVVFLVCVSVFADDSYYESRKLELADPPIKVESIDVSSTDWTPATPVRCLYVGTGGSVNATMAGGGTAVWQNVPSGSILPGFFSTVHSSGTNATDINAMW